jgi:hypothetical protein
VLALTPLLLVGVGQPALASVAVSRAELNSGRLRLEGQATPTHTITVDGAALGSSDAAGSFRIDRSGYPAPADCTVDVNDGSAAPFVARLTGCTVAAPPPPPAPSPPSPSPSPSASPAPPPPPPPPPPPSSTAVLDSVVLDPAVVQTGTTQSSLWLYFSGPLPQGGADVVLTSSDQSIATVPSATIPAFSSSGLLPVSIRATAVGTVTLSATWNGVTASALLTVQSGTLLRFLTAAVMPPAHVGANYTGFIEACCGQGGPYTWSLTGGIVPDGLSFAGNSLRLTRTTAVTGVARRLQVCTFTVRVKDAAGNSASQLFTLSVV